MNFTIIAGLGPDNSISCCHLVGTPQTSQTPRAPILPKPGKDSSGDKSVTQPKPPAKDKPFNLEVLGEEPDD